MIHDHHAERLRFEKFELHVRTGELLKKGRKMRLQDQPAKLLGLLVSHRGELVTRADIQKALWGNDEFVEFEHAINTAIRKIREVLDDDPENPRFVETLPRKGYRFIAVVEEIHEANTVDATKRLETTQTGSLASVPQPKEASATEIHHALPEVKADDDFALPARIARRLFLLIQTGYLVMYCAALYYSDSLDGGLGAEAAGLKPVNITLPVVLVMATCGIAVRLYLLSAIGFAHPAAGRKFQRLFPVLLVLDGVWAASPLLAVRKIGMGLALACIAGLAYLPFSQRTLMQSISHAKQPQGL